MYPIIIIRLPLPTQPNHFCFSHECQTYWVRCIRLFLKDKREHLKRASQQIVDQRVSGQSSHVSIGGGCFNHMVLYIIQGWRPEPQKVAGCFGSWGPGFPPKNVKCKLIFKKSKFGKMLFCTKWTTLVQRSISFIFNFFIIKHCQSLGVGGGFQ